MYSVVFWAKKFLNFLKIIIAIQKFHLITITCFHFKVNHSIKLLIRDFLSSKLALKSENLFRSIPCLIWWVEKDFHRTRAGMGVRRQGVNKFAFHFLIHASLRVLSRWENVFLRHTALRSLSNESARRTSALIGDNLRAEFRLRWQKRGAPWSDELITLFNLIAQDRGWTGATRWV